MSGLWLCLCLFPCRACPISVRFPGFSIAYFRISFLIAFFRPLFLCPSSAGGGGRGTPQPSPRVSPAIAPRTLRGAQSSATGQSVFVSVCVCGRTMSFCRHSASVCLILLLCVSLLRTPIHVVLVLATEALLTEASDRRIIDPLIAKLRSINEVSPTALRSCRSWLFLCFAFPLLISLFALRDSHTNLCSRVPYRR